MAIKSKEQKQTAPASKFTLWLFIVSIILLFGGLTSAYIVSRGIDLENKRWESFELPVIFWYNTALLIVSSMILQVGAWAARRGDFSRMKTALVLTFILGVFFLVAQILAWQMLYRDGIVFGGEFGRTRGNYLYVLTALHGLHIIAGLLFIGIVMGKALRGKYDGGNTVSFENSVTFWHFLGILWIYLFVFLFLINN